MVMRVDGTARRAPGAPRIGVVVLPLIAGLIGALPWLGRAAVPPLGRLDPGTLGIRTFGSSHLVPPTSYGLPGFTGPYWGWLLVGLAYVAAASFAARTNRRFQTGSFCLAGYASAAASASAFRSSHSRSRTTVPSHAAARPLRRGCQ